MKGRIQNIRILLESILCLCAEGPEFMDKIPLVERIAKDAALATKVCDELLTKVEG